MIPPRDFPPVRTMSPHEFRAALDGLHLNQRQAAERFGYGLRQIQHFIAGERAGPAGPIPVPVPAVFALMLRLMLSRGIKPSELDG